MSRAFIVEGDAHSHGGHVLAGSEHAGIDGQAFACEGHPAICPLHGRTHIEGASSHLNIHGRKAALDATNSRVALRSSLGDKGTLSTSSLSIFGPQHARL
uniref:PAAR domain-containing protein n=1 Tax=Xanthomonas oryzae TaxID=347 RepID=UPI003DA199F6